MDSKLPSTVRASEMIAARHPDPEFVASFLSGLPVELAASFDERQLFAIQQAFGRREEHRGWHLRLTLPWARYRISVARQDLPDRRCSLEGRGIWPVGVGALAGAAALAAGLLLLAA